MKRLALVLAALGYLSMPSKVEAACPGVGQTTLTTDGGQTFTFASSTCGQYANGDYWILKASGSLALTKTSPVPAGDLNGCELNFTGLPVWDGNHLHNPAAAQQRSQGFTYQHSAYDVTKNACPLNPFNVATDKTLMSAVSQAGAVYPSSSNITHFLTVIEPITIVSVQPAAGDFRPAYAVTSKASPGNISQILYDNLNDWGLARFTNEPTQVQAETLFRNIIFQSTIGVNQWQALIPAHNVGYNGNAGGWGRPIAAATADVFTFLSTDHTNAEKSVTAIRVIQQAIDIYGQYSIGFHWQNIAGFVWPAKSILLMGAALMNNSTWRDAVKTSSVGVHIWDEDQTYFYITASDVSTPRVANCADNNHAVDTYCVHTTGPTNWDYSYKTADIGKPAWCDNRYDWTGGGADCSKHPSSPYSWNASHQTVIALVLAKMSLLDEFDNQAWYDYLFNVNHTPETSGWYYTKVKTEGWFGGCNFPVAAVSASNGMKVYACSLIDAVFNDAAIDASPGGGAANQAPTIALTSPSSSLSQTTTAATIALAGTTSDSDGTVSSVVATADCDASVTATGTVSAWTRTVDLPANTSCTVTIVATDDDAATTTLVVMVLRSTGTCTGLADTFALTGSWPTPNPNCWTQMTGGLSWMNNQLQSAAAVRNLYYYNSIIANDQQAAVTVNFVPDANNWAYAQVRIAAGYDGYSCTAQNPISYIARWDDGVRVQLGSGYASTWTQGQTLTCKVTGTTVCLLQNGAELGGDSCETDATYASGFTGAGAWGTAGAIDNFVATALSGGGDVIPPVITITTPATNPLLVAATPYTLAAGTATDAVGVTSCTWVVLENTGENGTCTGTALPNTSVSWSITGGVDLVSTGNGNNTLQVTVADAAGHTATISTLIRYISPTGTWTYPNTGSAWTQRGRIVVLSGTFDVGVCDYVKLQDVFDPTTGVGPVTATGTDTWTAKVAVREGEVTSVTVSCMDDSGTPATLTDDVSLLDRVKVITSIKNRKWM